MEKDLAIYETIIDTIKRLQNKISSLEKQHRSFINRKDFSKLSQKLSAELSEIKKELKKAEKQYNNLRVSIENKISSVSKRLDILETKLTNSPSLEDISKINVELFNLNSNVTELSNEISKIKSEIEQLFNRILALEGIEKKVNSLSKEVSEITRKIDPNKIEEKFSDLTTKVLTINKLLEDLEKIYNELEERLSNLEELVENDQRSIDSQLSSLYERLDNIQRDLESINYLSAISPEDIKKLKKIDSFEELYKRIVDIENRINSLNRLINDLNKILFTLRTSISKINDDREKIVKLEVTLENTNKKLEGLENSVNSIKKEVEDLKDIVMVSAKDIEKLESKIMQIETKIKIENIEEVLDAFEKIKLLEGELERIKRIITGYSLPMNREGELYLKVKQLENAVRKLYETQNSILLSLNEKLAKIEEALKRS